MTPEERREHLKRVTAEFFARKPKYTLSELEKMGPL